MTHSYLLVATTYGAGTYDTNNYNGTSTTTTTGAGNGGTLSNTGVAIAGIVTVAAVLLLAAVAIRLWRRPSKKVQAVPVESDDSDDSADK